MRDRYPPLDALLFFLIASRTESFTLAAELLFVTRSAVSRRIKNLENYLDTELFYRYQSNLEFTSAGLEYANALSPIFADIKIATEALKGGGKNKLKITLNLSATFTTTWLLNRLPHLEETHPDLVVVFNTNYIDTGAEIVEFETRNFDAAILLGDGNWLNCHSEKLLNIYVQLVCSPKLLKVRAPLLPEYLTNYNWLHYQHLPNLWPNCLEAAGLSGLKTKKKNIVFDNVALATQAAVDGLGIIPMYRPFADPKIESGQLIIANEAMFKLPESYYFICPEEYQQLDGVKLFHDWITKQAEEFRVTWKK